MLRCGFVFFIFGLALAGEPALENEHLQELREECLANADEATFNAVKANYNPDACKEPAFDITSILQKSGTLENTNTVMGKYCPRIKKEIDCQISMFKATKPCRTEKFIFEQDLYQQMMLQTVALMCDPSQLQLRGYITRVGFDGYLAKTRETWRCVEQIKTEERRNGVLNIVPLGDVFRNCLTQTKVPFASE